MDYEEMKEIIKEAIEDIFFSEDEFSPFNSLNDKINSLLSTQKAELRMDFAIKMADKFEDYMKNVDKLNQMINEFKGLVSMVRGEAKVTQTENERLKKQLKKLLEILSEEV